MKTKSKRMLPFVALTLATLTLIGCKHSNPESVKFVPETVQQVKPAKPAPIALSNARYERCGKMACLSHKDATRELQNKAEVLRWMKGMNALVCYYEVREGSEVCVSGSSVSQ